ncbi:MAG: asparagine synthase (glutamine-hydrolyzing) [Nitrospirales bacterium]|nr:asparagine synthase (glutamine-hydrolyzing) [Nitrospirales bacterium]
MCGIVGIINPECTTAAELRHQLRRMGLWQFHRGPDEWGEWIQGHVALGHNRLSILDLEMGHQPMASSDGAIQVLFNGEIYNFRDLWDELAKKGHCFWTKNSDTEVILNGYREWGSGVFEKLEGMFAIAIWDQTHGSLLLARDRTGIKPLFYAVMKGGGLIFGSEPKAILASGLLNPHFDVDQLTSYFSFRAPRTPHCMLKGMSKLAAGYFLRYQKNSGVEAPIQYWSGHPTEVLSQSIKISEEQVEQKLEASVLSHLVADVPLGLFLSGGVDSSLMAALLSKQHIPIDAFTVGTDSPLDETPYATRVAKHLGITLHVHKVTSKDFFAHFEKWAYMNDDPVSDPSALALMVLTEYARGHGMKVMLAGDGADELFGGYSSYLRYLAFCFIAKIPLAPFVGTALADYCKGRNGDYLRTLGNLRFLGTGHLTDAWIRNEMFTPDLCRDPHFSLTEASNFQPDRISLSLLRTALLFDQKVRLPDDLLARTDRATMACSLETRVPFLDRQVVELANKLSDECCINLPRRNGKLVLKRILSRYLPSDLVYRSKRGFDLPLATWLTLEFREVISDYLSDRLVPGLEYRFIGQIYHIHCKSDARYTATLWAWLVMEKWYRLWIQKRATPALPFVVTNSAAYESLHS